MLSCISSKKKHDRDYESMPCAHANICSWEFDDSWTATTVLFFVQKMGWYPSFSIQVEYQNLSHPRRNQRLFDDSLVVAKPLMNPCIFFSVPRLVLFSWRTAHWDLRFPGVGCEAILQCQTPNGKIRPASAGEIACTWRELLKSISHMTLRWRIYHTKHFFLRIVFTFW